MTISTSVNQKPKRKILVYAVAFVFICQTLFAIPILAADEPGDAVIDTGDATAAIDVETLVNQNEFTNDPPAEEPAPGDDPPGDDSETLPAQEEPVDGNTTDISNTNEAEVDNTLVGDGNTGANEIPGGEGDSIIITGDADIDSTLTNDVNGNTAVVECDPCDNGDDASSTIMVKNTNNASTTNDVDLSGNTGDNEIASTSGTAIISTGDIGIINVIINFINHNIFGQGSQFFINVWNSVTETIDLSGFGEEPEELASELGVCEVNNCQISINNTNTGEIANDVIINANTGANLITNTGAESIIETGDINIASDVLNIANLNITGNDWFFAVVNIFGELEGDVILPPPDMAGQADSEAAEDLNLAEAIEEIGEHTAEVIITNTNNVNVMNNLSIEANSGENSISSGTSALIDTGNVNARAMAFNLINYNIFGDSWKFARVNIFGSWQGFINGLPDDYSYFEDEFGITVYSDILDDPELNEQFALLMADNDNYASSTNNVAIIANTGQNTILHGGDANISTGNINIYNSLLNFINSNFIGNNWEFSMINVFGDWQGNLAFGQPELWITETMKPKKEVVYGERITYTFLFGNNGDAVATDVVIVDDFDEDMIRIKNNGGGQSNQGHIEWYLGDIPPNTTGSISYTVQVDGNVERGYSTLVNQVAIYGAENDRDASNNTSGGSVQVYLPPRKTFDFEAATSGGQATVNLSVIKTNDAVDVLSPGDIVNFDIIIKNNGEGVSQKVYVMDTMSNIATGQVINEAFWDLETVYDQEEIIIEYALEITPDIRSGEYINEVMVEGWDPELGDYIVAVASSKIKVENNLLGPQKQDGPNLVVSKVRKSSWANPGDTVEYEIIIANDGLVKADDVVVIERLPEGLVFGKENGLTLKRWDLEHMNPGKIERLSYTIMVGNNTEPEFYLSEAEITAENHDALYIKTELEVRAVVALALEYTEPAQTPTIILAGPDKSAESVILAVNDSDDKTAIIEIEETKLNLSAKEASAASLSAVSPEVSVSSENMFRLIAKFLLGLTILIFFIVLLNFIKNKREQVF